MCTVWAPAGTGCRSLCAAAALLTTGTALHLSFPKDNRQPKPCRLIPKRRLRSKCPPGRCSSKFRKNSTANHLWRIPTSRASANDSAVILTGVVDSERQHPSWCLGSRQSYAGTSRDYRKNPWAKADVAARAGLAEKCSRPGNVQGHEFFDSSRFSFQKQNRVPVTWRDGENLDKCDRAIQERQRRRSPVVDGGKGCCADIVAQADLTLKDKTEKMPQTAMEISNTLTPPTQSQHEGWRKNTRQVPNPLMRENQA